MHSDGRSQAVANRPCADAADATVPPRRETKSNRTATTRRTLLVAALTNS